MSDMQQHDALRASNQETGSFRKLVERRITLDEYIRDLDRRASELGERAGAGLADAARRLASHSASRR